MQALDTSPRSRVAAPISDQDGAALAAASAERIAPMRALTVAGLGGVAITAFVLRVVLAGRQSAYMDEASMILTGRTLIESRAVYADALAWAYGSFLWPLLAGAADIAGGLRAVRLLTAGLGTVMAVATAATAFALAPAGGRTPRRTTAALLAGLIMAVFPTAIAVGRFGSYDALGGAAFMSGVALLAAVRPTAGRVRLLAAAALLFIAFLAKYVVAIYFPAVCLYLLLAPRRTRLVLHHLVWFVGPLGAACAAYFVTFHAALLNLLQFSTGYTDLKSSQPWREYALERPELWLLALLAAAGWRSASRTERAVALAGTAIIAAFQAAGRSDFDFWKHSIYVIFFLAPLAGLALARVAELAVHVALAGFGWRRCTGTERVVAVGAALTLLLLQARLWLDGHVHGWGWLTLAILALPPLATLAFAPLAARTPSPGHDGRVPRSPAKAEGRLAFRTPRYPSHPARRALVVTAAIGAVLPLTLLPLAATANDLVTFYPNLTRSLDAIHAHTAGARRVLADDSVLRYYLRDALPYQRVTDPFFITYKGREDMDAYRLAITDRYFDAIVLDGGVGPLGHRLRAELGGLIGQYYVRTYTGTLPSGGAVEVYRAREDPPPPPDEPEIDGPGVVYFDGGPHGWGGHPEGGEVQPGLQATVGSERAWNGHPTLRFDATREVSLLGVRVDGQVSQVRLRVYIVPRSDQQPEVRLGMVGFDAGWQWRDDSFTNVLSTGRWHTLTWRLSAPGEYHEIGLKLPDDGTTTLYLGRVEITP